MVNTTVNFRHETMPNSSFENFYIDSYAMRYSRFAPRLLNFCLSLGMKPNRIMPSRAFCSDENQGYPIILLAKHFGTFPFNHGRVGGVVATDRHVPHAHHGRDVVVIQASHVGYDLESNQFGVYRRLQTEHHEMSTDCGAVCNILGWYQQEYHFASQQILLDRDQEGHFIIYIDNQLLNVVREEGLFLDFKKIIKNREVIRTLSTSKVFRAANDIIKSMGDNWPQRKSAIGERLVPELFSFNRKSDDIVASGLLNRNLIHAMPRIITAKFPALAAAKVNAQMEFDRTYRTILKEEAYRGKKLVFISGLHIDVSPQLGQLFPLTKFVPWAAYIQQENGQGHTLEQQEIYTALMEQSVENSYKVDLTAAIHKMEKEPEIRLKIDSIE